MRPTPVTRGLVVALLPFALALASCERKTPEPELTFESSRDTSGLSQGEDVLASFEPYRMDNGAVRVRGRMRLPDSTKVEIRIERPDRPIAVAMAHAEVLGGQFDSPPMLGEAGPLPHGAYRYQVRVIFDEAWQPLRVLHETASGASLRGPGMTRTREGGAMLALEREGTL